MNKKNHEEQRRESKKVFALVPERVEKCGMAVTNDRYYAAKKK